MELLTILLSSLLAAISPAGLILDTVLEDTLRSQVEAVEQLEVRIDNTPSYQVLQGKVDRIRIASRGVEPIANLRIETLELETDPINVDLERLRQGGKNSVTESLRQPLQGVVHLVVTETDLNQALQSPEIQSRLQALVNDLIPQQEDLPPRRFELSNSHLDFLGDNRLRLQVQLRSLDAQEQVSPPLDLVLEVGFNVVAGRTLELIEPTGSLNGRKLSPRLLQGFAEGLNSQLDLRTLEKTGVTARLLQLKLSQDEINLVAFVRFEAQKRDEE